jgi:hypothetical protein
MICPFSISAKSSNLLGISKNNCLNPTTKKPIEMNVNKKKQKMFFILSTPSIMILTFAILELWTEISTLDTFSTSLHKK